VASRRPVPRGRHGVAAGAFDQGGHRRTPGLADEQVSLPVTRDSPVGGLGGTGVDAGHAHDPGSRVVCSPTGTAPGTPRPQQDPLAGQLTLGQRIDPGVDRLMRHRVGHPCSVVTRVFVAQPARDLVRGVPGPQPPDHLGAQSRSGIELADLRSPPRHRGHPCGAGGPVAFPAAVAGDLPADDARVPPDPGRDHPALDTRGDPAGDLLPVRRRQPDPSPGCGPGSGGAGGQRTGLPSPLQGACGVARDGSSVAALDRRASAAPDRHYHGQANGSLPARAHPPAPPDPSTTATSPVPILATGTPRRHTLTDDHA